MDLYIGLMSGTSLDGIDALLADFSQTLPTVLATYRLDFPHDLWENLTQLVNTGKVTSLAKLGQTHTYLGECYAKAVNALLAQTKFQAKDIRAIGNHGQTIFHHPGQPHPFTMQIGNNSVLAAQTQIAVVGDFRSQDMAYGGQGAPLAPIFHQAFLAEASQKIAIVNIGGIANVTILEGNRLLAAFDTGPGNGLIDTVMQTYFNKPYDDNGALAKQGAINESLLQTLLADPYFASASPKSTGKEYFNLAWLKPKLDPKLRLNDLLRTLTELTAITIKQALEPFTPQVSWVCGGGAFNTFLMEQLAMQSISAKGFDPQMIEPLAFAYLAKLRLENRRLDLSHITGSNTPLLLGQIFYP